MLRFGKNMKRNALTFPPDSFLARINKDSWEQLSSAWTVRTYPARQFLIAADDDNNRDVFFVLDGSVRATVYTDGGREVSLLTFTNGDTIGEFSAIDDAPRSANAIAEVDSIIARLSDMEFRALLQRNPDLSYTMLTLMIGHLRRLSKRVIDFNAKSADERLREKILELAVHAARGENAVIIERPPTQAELAAVVFSSRESVAREMGRMIRAGLLSRIRRSLHVPDIEKLREYAEG